MQNSSAEELISELGSLIGIPSLRANADGRCHLLFDGSAMVEISHVPQQSRWMLNCGFEKMQLTASELTLLLRGNWMGAGFGGGWAALDDQQRVVLHLPVAFADANASSLLQATELLLDHAERWTKSLMENRANQSSAPAAMEMWAQRI